jgi:hypothetical protein
MDIQALQAEFRRCYFIRRRNTAIAAVLSIGAGVAISLAVGQLSAIAGVLVGIASVGAAVVVTLAVYALSEPPSHDFSEFVEIVETAKHHKGAP